MLNGQNIHKMNKIALSLIALTTILFSCKDDEPSDEHPHLSINVSHQVDAQELLFDTLLYVNAAGHKYEVQTLKYFVSNIVLHKSSGSNISLKGPFYIDAEDASTFSIDTDVDITEGSYDKITLTFGLDSITNQSNTLTGTNEIAMAWPDQMGGGYHYMKLEGQYDSLQLGTMKSYAVHTGATMGTPYHVDVEIPNSNFSVGDKDLSIQLKMNINEWFTDPNNYNFADFGHMIMMEMSAQMQLKANGTSVFTSEVQ